MWMVLIIVVRDIVITGFRSYAVFKGKSIATTMLAKTKTVGQFGVIYIIFIYHLISGLDSSRTADAIVFGFQKFHILLILMYVITLLTVVSGFAYLSGNRSHLRSMAIDIYRLIVSSDIKDTGS